MSGESLLTTGQVAQMIGVSLTTVDNYIYKGYLEPDRVLPTGRRLFKQETIDKFMDDCMKGEEN